jgi:hypothetical protein
MATQTQQTTGGTTAGSLTQNLQALTGNDVLIFFGTQQVGYLQNFQAQDSNNLQTLGGIGDAHPQENVPSMYSGNISASRAVLRKSSLFDLLNQQASGSGSGTTGTQAPPFGSIDGALQGWVFDIVCKQKGENQNLRVYQHCSFDNFSTSIEAHNIIVTNFTLKALSVDYNATWTGTGWRGVSDMDTASS